MADSLVNFFDITVVSSVRGKLKTVCDIRINSYDINQTYGYSILISAHSTLRTDTFSRMVIDDSNRVRVKTSKVLIATSLVMAALDVEFQFD